MTLYFGFSSRRKRRRFFSHPYCATCRRKCKPRKFPESDEWACSFCGGYDLTSSKMARKALIFYSRISLPWAWP